MFIRRNIDDDTPGDYLKSCQYRSDNETDRYCPIFTLGQIVEMAGEDFTNLSIQVSPIPIPRCDYGSHSHSMEWIGEMYICSHVLVMVNFPFQGGVIGLSIEWNCNLDWPYGWDKCNPVYSAKRYKKRESILYMSRNEF